MDSPEHRLAILKNATPILTLEDWESCAAFGSPDHWSDGRPAKEAARAWLEGDELPKELRTALKHHDAFGKVTRWAGEPLVALPFDRPTEAPIADLVVEAEDEHGTYLIVVDAKSDDPFGDTVGDTLAAALETLLENQSDAIGCITRLTAALSGPRQEDDPALKDVRYGLLTATAGCLAEAERRGHTRALLLIQEFVTDRTVDRKLLQNTIDLGRFVKRLSHGAFKGLNAGDIAGPIRVPGAPLLSPTIDLHIGKISRNLRAQNKSKGRP